MIIRVSKYLVTPCISHLDHVEAEQPYLGDLLAMVVNHLLTPPSEVRVSLGAEARIYQNFTRFFFQTNFHAWCAIFSWSKDNMYVAFLFKKNGWRLPPAFSRKLYLESQISPAKRKRQDLPAFCQNQTGAPLAGWSSRSVWGNFRKISVCPL